jgi:hypothetical protein
MPDVRRSTNRSAGYQTRRQDEQKLLNAATQRTQSQIPLHDDEIGELQHGSVELRQQIVAHDLQLSRCEPNNQDESRQFGQEGSAATLAVSTQRNDREFRPSCPTTEPHTSRFRKCRHIRQNATQQGQHIPPLFMTRAPTQRKGRTARNWRLPVSSRVWKRGQSNAVKLTVPRTK